MKDTFNNLSPPQQRFIKHLEEQPCYGKEKNMGQYGPKADALKHGHYIQLHRAKHAYLGLDLDYEAAVLSWMDEVLPAPTIAFHNPTTGHANLFWELKVPIYKRCELNQYKARMHPLRYFKAVQEGYRQKLDGDSGYTSVTSKNPFSDRWEVHWRDEQYTLKYLAEFVTLQNIITYTAKDLDEHGNYAGRNDELFHTARKKAYHWIFCLDEKSFESAVRQFCRDYNQEQIPIHYPESGPLAMSEVATIAEGIIKFCIQNKNSGGFKQRAKNHGAMNLPAINPDFDDEIKQQITSCNQARGAAYTHRIRKQSTQQKISDAIATIRSQGRYVVKKEVAQLAGVSRATLRYYKDLF